MIEILLERLKTSKLINEIVVAIPKSDKKLEDILKKQTRSLSRSNQNVLERYYLSAKKYKADIIVRITGDCPLIDSQMIDIGLKKYLNSKFDYISNINPPTFPDGLDYEIFDFKTLKKTYLNAKSKSDKEHVTKYIIKNSEFKKFNIESETDYSDLRLTLDYKEDLILIKYILNKLDYHNQFRYRDIIQLYKKNQKPFKINSKNFRNQKKDKISKGQSMWNSSKKYIAGGNMLFSKRPDCFLPEKWPSYFKQTAGCKVRDLDNKVYYDLCHMSVGTNTLGYSNKYVDQEVMKIVKQGNISTLNCPEEVILAKN